jgi:LysM repeat protein
MIVRLLCLFLLTAGVLWSAPESLAVQEMRLSLENLERYLHSHTVDLTLFQERIQQIETTLSTLKQDLKLASSDKSLERRIIALEKGQEALVADCKVLKNHLTETATSLSQCQSQLTKIDKQLSSDIQSLKTNLQSMLALLQSPTSAGIYVVQSGDSLGQIALQHKTDIKTLKKLNNLSSDTIFVGQKLQIP